MGTRFSFARLGIGRGSSRTVSDLQIDMMTDVDSAGSVRPAVRKDPHSQWETYTISIPSMRYASPSPRSSRFPSYKSPLPSPTAAHTRHDSGARLLDRGHLEERDYDVESLKEIDSGYHDPVENNLSPRTSEARSNSGRQSYIPSVPYLTYEEPAPVEENPRISTKFWRRSGGSSRRLSTSTSPRTPAEDSRRTSKDGSRRLSVRFDPSVSQQPSIAPRYSFLDFSSTPPSSNSSDILTAPAEREGSRAVPPAAPSAAVKPIIKGPRPLPSIAVSVPLGLMDSQPLPRDSLQSPYPRSLTVSPVDPSETSTETRSTPTPPDYQHMQYFSPVAPSPSTRTPIYPLPRMPPSARPSDLEPLNVVPSIDQYNPQFRGVEESPTDSFARSVSEINFRHMSASTSSSRRTSNYHAQYVPVVHKPLIVQKILGMQASPSALHPEGSETPRASTPRLEPLRRVEEPEMLSPSPSTPFMQRVLRIGGGHERGLSQASSQDFSTKSASPGGLSPSNSRSNMRKS